MSLWPQSNEGRKDMTPKKSPKSMMSAARRIFACSFAAGIFCIGLAAGQDAPAAAPPAAAPPAAAPANDHETLRQYADQLNFGVGVFIQPNFWKRDPRFGQTMGREFNTAVAYAVKIQEERGHYNFNIMDQEIEFAKQHHMKLFGAGLIYRNNAAPEWLHFSPNNCGG